MSKEESPRPPSLVPAFPKSFPLDSFGLPEETIENLSRLVGSAEGCLILLHGMQNTGKTSLAISLSVACEKKPFHFRQASDALIDAIQEDLEKMEASVDARTTTVIISDDDLLSFKSPFACALPRKWTEEFMVSNHQSVLWITHAMEEIPSRVVGLFDYVLEMKDALGNSFEWPASIPPAWHTDLAKYRDSAFVLLYKAVEVWERTCSPEDDPTKSLSRLIDILQRKLSNSKVKSTPSVLSPISRSFNPALWNSDRDLTEISRDVGQYLKWVTAHPEERQPFAILCTGVGGCGKTEFAKYLANEHGRELKVYRYSDLASMFVGQSEVNIAQAFKDASPGDFLLMDEVDSMLSSRSQARFSWERTQTNELLTQIENYPGVIIACTNLVTILDLSVQRRFTKVTLSALREDQLAIAWRLYFPTVPVPERGLEELAGSATPGDFRLVANGIQFKTTTPSPSDILSLLAFEQNAKERFSDRKKAVGFR